MYLIVFVTLVIGLIGIYAQILSLQAARIASSISAFGNSMVTWHVAAVSMGASVVDTYKKNGLTLTLPCSLTYILPTPALPGFSQCPQPIGVTDGSTKGTVVTSTFGLNSIIDGNGNAVPVHLPADFRASQVQFYSVLYQDSLSSQYYVVTFVSPATISAANPSPGYLSIPPNTGSLVSYTATDLMHQLSLTQIPQYAYGMARSSPGSSVLLSPAAAATELQVDSTTAVLYNLPMVSGTTPIVGTGGVAVVSSVSGF